AADALGWRRDTLLLHAADRLDQLLNVRSHSRAADELVTHNRPVSIHIERHFGRTRGAGPAAEAGANLPQDARVEGAHRTALALETADELAPVPVHRTAAAAYRDRLRARRGGGGRDLGGPGLLLPRRRRGRRRGGPGLPL